MIGFTPAAAGQGERVAEIRLDRSTWQPGRDGSPVSVGVGGRYWQLQADKAHTTAFPFSPPSPMKFETGRYGGFAQLSYRLADFGFGETGAPAAPIRKD